MKKLFGCLILSAAMTLNAATIYVRSTDGSDSDDGSTWALAKATLAGAFTAASAGDTIYVSDNHAETQASAMTLTSPGTAASPCKVLCADDAAEPPTALATTATITTTGTSSITLAGFAYMYGITLNCGTGVGNSAIQWSSLSPYYWKLDSCSLRLNGPSAAATRITIGANNTNTDDGWVDLINTTIHFNGVAQNILVQARLRWRGTASAIGGAAQPTYLFQGNNGPAGMTEVEGVDLSALGSGKTLVASGPSPSLYSFLNCKLGSSVSLTTASAGPGGFVVKAVNCDSGDTNYKFQTETYEGSITHEATIVRTSGASDGTTSFSRKMVSSANAKFFDPLESDPILVWNETTGSALNLSVAVITDNVTLTDAEAWVEVDYLGTSGYPLGVFASDRATTILSSAANQTTDGSSTWNTTGLTTPIKQTLSVSFTPQEKGLIRARVCLAKASTTMYYDPKASVQ